MRAPRSSAIAVAVVLAAVAALWALWPRLDSMTNRDASQRVAGTASSRTSSASAGPVSSSRTPPPVHIAVASPAPGAVFAPVPPINTPLRLVYRQLKEQASAGDATAQCRLATELIRCTETMPRMVEGMKDAPERYSKLPNGDRALAILQQEVRKVQSVCQDFTPDPEDEAWRWMLQGGLNGNHTAALQFVMGFGLDSLHFLSDMEGWAAYRQYAPQLLRQAIADGDPRAYQVAAFHGRVNLFGASLTPDPVQLAAYELAVMTIADPNYRVSLQKQVDSMHLSDADLTQAQARAASLAASLKVPPDVGTITGGNIIGYGKWTDGADCEH